MRRLAWFGLVALVVSGMALTSCKAAGGGGKKPDKGTSASKSGGTVKAGTIVFKFIPTEGDVPEEIFLAGSMNGWNPSDPNYQFEADDDNVFSVEVDLDAGTYKYKYVLDGQWPPKMDDLEENLEPKPTRYEDDGFGGMNAVLEVEE